VRAFALAPAAILLAGCVSKQVARLDAWHSARNCHFSHVAKGEFETALRRVFDASRPHVYGLRPEEGGALIEQHWALDVVFTSASGVERWRIEYAPAGDGIDAHAEVEHVRDRSVLPAGNAVVPADGTAGYQLLWSRLDYVLGNRTDWPRCKSASKRSRGPSPDPLPTSGLCGPGASDAAPPKLARTS
jgi:hypothetical protein